MFNDIAFNILSVHKISRKNYFVINTNRKFHAISIRVNGEAKFEYQNKVKFANTGSITYFPAYLDYTITSDNEDLIIIHFDVFNYKSEDIEIFEPLDMNVYVDLFESIYLNWNNRFYGYKHQCAALLYTMFSMMENNKFNQVIIKSAIPPSIKKSFEYLHKNFTDKDLSIEFLANLAGVSDVYYRRIFNKFYGETPLKYINDMRIKHACELLKSNLYTIGETADKSGFYDNKYFSTVFKKYMGISPSDYKHI